MPYDCNTIDNPLCEVCFTLNGIVNDVRGNTLFIHWSTLCWWIPRLWLLMYIMQNIGMYVNEPQPKQMSWWRHQMETFSALLAICARSSPVTGEFAAQKPVTRRLDVFFLSAPR